MILIMILISIECLCVHKYRVKSSMIACIIGHRHLTLGLKGVPPFIDVCMYVRLNVIERYIM